MERFLFHSHIFMFLAKVSKHLLKDGSHLRFNNKENFMLIREILRKYLSDKIITIGTMLYQRICTLAVIFNFICNVHH